MVRSIEEKAQRKRNRAKGIKTRQQEVIDAYAARREEARTNYLGDVLALSSLASVASRGGYRVAAKETFSDEHVRLLAEVSDDEAHDK